MDSSPSPNAGSFDETIDTGAQPEEGRACVEMVAGSTPCLTKETHLLLRARLRGAAVIMLIGFVAFLFTFPLIDAETAASPVLFVMQLGVIAVLAVCTAVLFKACPGVLPKLRILEVVIFGVPAVFFVAMQSIGLENGAALGYCRNPTPAWLLLIFTYTTFIPNTWRRAAAIVAPMAIAPLAMVTVTAWRSQVMADVVVAGNYAEYALVMSLATLVAVYGTHVVRALREEAFEARQLGQYHLKQRIGAGGMGEVYLAEHRLLKRPCAVKLIRPGRAADPQALARFEREVQAAANLSHWNTIEIFDYGRTDDGTFYYAMEYLPGLSLDDLVKRHGPLSPGRAIYLLRQVCDGLREAHEMGLVHRDVKPGNIIASERGGIYDVAKVLDFGLVKPIVEDDLQLTMDGGVTGSPLYLSPEQASGSAADARSDLYSLGAVAYFLVTGQPPFQRPKAIQILMAHVHDPLTSPTELRPDLPADLEQVIVRALSKSPADRLQTAVEFDAALAACDADGSWTRADAANWWKELSTHKGVSPDWQLSEQGQQIHIH